MDAKIALIGFGEAGETFAAAARWQAAAAWDTLAQRRLAASSLGLLGAASPEEALNGAKLVLSLVTADQALAAARHYGPMLEPNTLWCDLNSVAPETKRQAAHAVLSSGGQYADVAVLAPVNPARLAVPLLVSGHNADAAVAALSIAGFEAVRAVGAEVGRASAIKMIRSVMIKGIEGLTAEMMLAADAAGVTDEVLASLDASEKWRSWKDRTAYSLERMTTHGARRAAEMQEAATTLSSLGVEPLMTRGTVARQRAMAEPKAVDRP